MTTTRAGEFDLIARIRRRAVTRDDVVLGIGDDAALMQVPAGRQLVVAMDTLNAGVHFPRDTAPADIGWKALAVNLSDLAAMGAEPAWCTLSLSLPTSDPAWLDAFLDGFGALARPHRVALVGGDTTRGRLSVCVTAHGFIEPGRALRRDAAQAGDDVWVSGTLGDAAGGLRFALALDDARERKATHVAWLRERLDRPTPRVALGRALQGVAHAAIDVSDGLLGDLGHVLRRSGVGATIDAGCAPGLLAASKAMKLDEQRVQDLVLAGGDDYELAFTAPAGKRAEVEGAARSAATQVTRIGRIDADSGLRVLAPDGRPLGRSFAGFDHFGA